jgi:hypothetical protein
MPAVTSNGMMQNSTTSSIEAPIETADGAYWILRVGAALCFIGHGAFGFITKAAWLPYFAVVGIPESLAWKIQPLVGAIDVLAAMAVLFAPRGLPLVYMSVWALWTALLRPMAGQDGWEAVERAGNYGVPFALLVLTGLPTSIRNLFTRRDGKAFAESSVERVRVILKWTTVLLLLGHGALGALSGKELLTSQYASIGLPGSTTMMLGWFEIALAVAVAIRPISGLLLFIAAWKLGTESLFVVTGAPIWEVVERAGSYAAPLALAVLMSKSYISNVARGLFGAARGAIERVA